MKRTLFAWVGVILLATFPLGVAILGWTAAIQSPGIAICFRVGVLCSATALAWPQLRSMGSRFPVAVWAILGGALLIIAVRPKLRLVALLLAVVALALHFGLRAASKFLKK